MSAQRYWVMLCCLGLLLGPPACENEATAPAPDHQPPAIISIHPADGAVAVQPDTEIRVRFSEPISLSWMSGAPLHVQSGGALLAGAIELDAGDHQLVFRPDEALATFADFALTVMPGIADIAGNIRQEPIFARFSTGIALSGIGRVFTANEISMDISVFALPDYDEVPGSPVPLGVLPRRLRAVPAEGAIYVLYYDWRHQPGGGVMVLDALSLAILRRSGPILPASVSDIAVSHEDDRVQVAAPLEDAVFVLAARTLEQIRDPLFIQPPGSGPNVLSISSRRRMLLVGLAGASRLAAYHLPSLDPVDGFPLTVAPQTHTIAVDEARRRAWLGGRLRYSVVDLINPERSLTLEMPQPCSPVPCDFVGMCRLVLDPVRDRVYMLDRRNALTSVVLSTILTAPESPGSTAGYNLDVELDPRTGNLLVLGLRNLASPLRLVNATTLEEIVVPMPTAGDKAVDIEILP